MTVLFSEADAYRPECIEPDLGEQLWRLDDPASAPALVTELELHVAHCAACRCQVSLQRDVADGLGSGQLTLTVPPDHRRRWDRWSFGGGGMLLAACLALVFILPPSLTTDALIMRGADTPVIESPLPDVVIHDRTPVLRWTRMERATRYRVSVRAVDNEYHWQGEATASALAVPSDKPLPVSSRLRIEVAPVPAHVAPDGALRSSFRTGTWPEFVGFRLAAAKQPLLAGMAVGAMGLVAGLVIAVRRRG